MSGWLLVGLLVVGWMLGSALVLAALGFLTARDVEAMDATELHALDVELDALAAAHVELEVW